MIGKRRDNNQKTIIRRLNARGISTHDTASLGNGFPDVLAVREDGEMVLLEIKMPGEKLTPAEQKFHDTFPGRKEIVYSVEDAFHATLKQYTQ
jgi:hypothetical protein